MRNTKASAILALIILAASTSNLGAALVGNDVSVGRASATDGAPEVFQVYSNAPITGAGTLTSFSIFDQGGNNQAGYDFHAYLLRPQGGGVFKVIQDNLLAPAGSNATKSYDTPDVAVQANDLIAHFGRGVPFTEGFPNPPGPSYVPIYYPSSHAPALNESITLGSADYPANNNFIRDYAFAANVEVPEPASLSLAGLGAIALLRRRRR